MEKLMIFDMDGTLFDTAEANYRAYRKAAGEYGYQIDRTGFMESFIGKNYKDFLPLFKVKDEDLSLIHERKKECYTEFLDCIKPNESLFALIRQRRGKCRIALATTASKKNSFDILEHFGVTDLFDYILTQGDVKNLKPSPECYLKIMEMAACAPNETTIYEDSAVGIMAAEASGARCVKVEAW